MGGRKRKVISNSVNLCVLFSWTRCIAIVDGRKARFDERKARGTRNRFHERAAPITRARQAVVRKLTLSDLQQICEGLSLLFEDPAKHVSWIRGNRGRSLWRGALSIFLVTYFFPSVMFFPSVPNRRRKWIVRRRTLVFGSVKLFKKKIPIFENGSFEILWGKCCIKSEIWEIKFKYMPYFSLFNICQSIITWQAFLWHLLTKQTTHTSFKKHVHCLMGGKMFQSPIHEIRDIIQM